MALRSGWVFETGATQLNFLSSRLALVHFELRWGSGGGTNSMSCHHVPSSSVATLGPPAALQIHFSLSSDKQLEACLTKHKHLKAGGCLSESMPPFPIPYLFAYPNKSLRSEGTSVEGSDSLRMEGFCPSLLFCCDKVLTKTSWGGKGLFGLPVQVTVYG